MRESDLNNVNMKNKMKLYLTFVGVILRRQLDHTSVIRISPLLKTTNSRSSSFSRRTLKALRGTAHLD